MILGDIRNKSILDVITTDNMSNVNVHSMPTKKETNCDSNG